MNKGNSTVELDIQSVKGLIAKKAIESWRKLPRRTQCIVSIEDMIQDGTLCVSKFLIKGSYNKNKGKLTTILWQKLDNFYHRGAELLNANKRFDGFNESLDFLKEEKGYDTPTSEEESEIREHIRNVFLDVYTNASDKCRESIRRWFLQMENTKVHTKGNRFLKDKKEFKTLADRFGLDVQDCRTLMHCTQIRNEVISRLPEYQYMEIQ